MNVEERRAASRLGGPNIGWAWARERPDGLPVYDLPSVTIARSRRASDGTWQWQPLADDRWRDSCSARRTIVEQLATRHAVRALVAWLSRFGT